MGCGIKGLISHKKIIFFNSSKCNVKKSLKHILSITQQAGLIKNPSFKNYNFKFILKVQITSGLIGICTMASLHFSGNIKEPESVDIC